MKKPNLYKCGLKKRPVNGNLLYNGRLIYEDKPFALLQHLKKRLIEVENYNIKNFKITNYESNMYK